MNSQILKLAQNAKAACQSLARLSTTRKNELLLHMAEALEDSKTSQEILFQNQLDFEAAQKNGTSEAMLDRLKLNPGRLSAMAQGFRDIVALPDPIGEVKRDFTRPNGLQITEVRVPLGVVGIVYEARPNVTTDAIAITLKTSNVVILRGSSNTLRTNQALVNVLKKVLITLGENPDFINLVESPNREDLYDLMSLRDYIDVIIPRGGAGLIHATLEHSKVPVIETGLGNCHLYVDDAADLDRARAILINGKTQRPSVCNALETLLVHKDIAKAFLKKAKPELDRFNVEIRGDAATCEILPDAVLATEKDYVTEYNDFILAVKVVNSFDEALAHIARYSTGHSEAIVTENQAHAERFLAEVDAAAVYVNASTRFTDGFEFGFGAEIGISTQKLHARGPMGLPELTSSKYLIRGTGQVRE